MKLLVAVVILLSLLASIHTFDYFGNVDWIPIETKSTDGYYGLGCQRPYLTPIEEARYRSYSYDAMEEIAAVVIFKNPIEQNQVGKCKTIQAYHHSYRLKLYQILLRYKFFEEYYVDMHTIQPLPKHLVKNCEEEVKVEMCDVKQMYEKMEEVKKQFPKLSKRTQRLIREAGSTGFYSFFHNTDDEDIDESYDAELIIRHIRGIDDHGYEKIRELMFKIKK